MWGYCQAKDTWRSQNQLPLLWTSLQLSWFSLPGHRHSHWPCPPPSSPQTYSPYPGKQTHIHTLALNQFFNSYFISSIRAWNSLPSDIVLCTSISAFKNALKLYYAEANTCSYISMRHAQTKCTSLWQSECCSLSLAPWLQGYPHLYIKRGEWNKAVVLYQSNECLI